MAFFAYKHMAGSAVRRLPDIFLYVKLRESQLVAVFSSHPVVSEKIKFYAKVMRFLLLPVLRATPSMLHNFRRKR